MREGAMKVDQQQGHQLKQQWETEDKSAKTLEDVKRLAQLVSKAARQIKGQTNFSEHLYEQTVAIHKRTVRTANELSDQVSNTDRRLKVLENQIRDSRNNSIMWAAGVATVVSLTLALLLAPRTAENAQPQQVQQVQGAKQ
jgi:hypothetical protein